MESLELIRQWIPLLIPVVILQLALMAAALVDVFRREKTKGPKWVWIVVIIAFNLIGPLVYFIAGREE
jgi:hypothetical protein